MTNVFRFICLCFGLAGMVFLTSGAKASLDSGRGHSPDEPSDSLDQQNEMTAMSIDIQSEAELERLKELIDLLDLSPEVDFFENGRIILKLPKDQMILLAGQIWLEK